MDLDALAQSIRQTSSDPIALNISDFLVSWKDDKATVTELEQRIEIHLDKILAKNAEEHGKIYSLWSEFRGEAIYGIRGMTMNERLYCFSLFPRWENTATDEEQKAIYAKLLANP